MEPPLKKFKMLRDCLEEINAEVLDSEEKNNPKKNPPTNPPQNTNTNQDDPQKFIKDFIIFFPPLPPRKRSRSVEPVNGDNDSDDEDYNPDENEKQQKLEIDCDKSDCDHEEWLDDMEPDPKDTELKEITTVKDIGDLIKLGRLYHCKRRAAYMGVDLKRLHHLRKPLGKLYRLIGMTKIKETVVNLIVYFLSGLQSGNDDMMHTVIEGPPGSGKTEVGRILGEIYRNMGLLDSNIFRIVKRSELVGKYLGHSAAKTQDVIDSCKGGVMFIDEAYALGDNEGRDSFSKECLDTLNQNLSDNKNQFLCIIAGYTGALEKNFFAFNEGLRRRFTFKYLIDKYTAEELKEIFLLKVNEFRWRVADDVNLNEFFKKNYGLFPHFGGDMETLFLNMRIYHGRRIFCLDKDLHRKLLNKEDFEEGMKIFSGHRKNHAVDEEVKKMKEYSMYL